MLLRLVRPEVILVVTVMCLAFAPATLGAQEPAPTPPKFPIEFEANGTLPFHGRMIDLQVRWRFGTAPRSFFGFSTHDDLMHSFNVSTLNPADVTCDTEWEAGSSQSLLNWISTSYAKFAGVEIIAGRKCNLWSNTDIEGLSLCAAGNELVQVTTPAVAGGFQFNFSSFAARSQSPYLDVPPFCDYDGPATPPFGLYDGFENGRVADFWLPAGAAYQRWVPGHITVQSDIVRSGTHAANITIYPGDVKQGNSERDELDGREWIILDQDIWYGWSQYLPADFPIVKDRLVMGQWKQGGLGDVSPLFAQRFVDGDWYFTVCVELNSTTKQAYHVGALQLGVWHDMVFNMKFSRTDEGYFRVWHNGTQIVNYEGRTAQLAAGGDSFYNKFGLYRDLWPTTWTVYFDDYSVGHSFADVDPRRFDDNYPEAADDDDTGNDD